MINKINRIFGFGCIPAILFFSGCLFPSAGASADNYLTGENMYIFVCKEDNDLFRLFKEMGKNPSRYSSTEESLKNAPMGSGILILADGYPGITTDIPPSIFEDAKSKNIRLYIEYPSFLPGLEIGKPRDTKFERLVVNSDFFGASLKRMQLLAVNGLHYTPVEIAEPYIVAARVAGFDNAVFGLSGNVDPILFPYKNGNALIATTKLSNFITGRFGPQAAWKIVWQSILEWLQPGKAPELKWIPMVRPSFSENEPLPKDIEKQSLKRGIEWFINSKLLLHPSRVKEIDTAVFYNQGIVPPPPQDSPVGDGSLGILEAPLSIILSDGSQMQSISKRSDCTGESAMALALGGKVFGENDKKKIAKNLLDYLYFKSDASKKERADEKHGAFGLLAWGVTNDAWLIANYGDDNANAMLGTLATAAVLGEDSWDESVMKCLLANLRTTGKLGFRDDRIDLPQLTEKGWKYFFDREIVSYSPHMESYLWACNLWAYQKTGYELFYTKAERAIRMTMAVYTDGWRWTNGLAQEKARMLLPLSWLVRVKDTPEHRQWLSTAIDGLLALQEPCGAIREELGLPNKGMFPPPDSNENYGEHEAPLIQKMVIR